MKHPFFSTPAVCLMSVVSLVQGSIAADPAPARPTAEPKEGGTQIKAEDLQMVTAGERAKMLVTYLARRDRRADLFGLAMDPAKPLAARKIEKVLEPEKPVVADSSMLQEAVKRIQITGVLPSHQQVIIGAQTAKVGTRINVRQGDVTFKLTISRISSAGVMLKDLETGEEVLAGGTANTAMAPGISAGPQGSQGSIQGIIPMGGRGIVIE